ncbi:MAG: histidine kinase, partial [Polyangiaceae bacterium]
LLQGAADYVAGRGIGRFAFLTFELPVLMLALSAAYAWSIRRHTTAVQSLLLGMATSTVLGCVFGFLYAWVSERVPEMRMHFPNGAVSFPRSALFGVLSAQLYFGLWALAFVYPHAVESARVRTLEAKQLRSEAELAHLRAHLEPHFLLNTLNTIAGLVTEDPREARRLIVCLGDLLRDAVQDTSEHQRLDRQITWLRRYAEILEARHHRSLTFEWEIAPALDNIMLPRLLLQPLVENAVKHGALRREDGAGKVRVTASRAEDGALVCIIEDNGPGIGEEGVRQGAFGLQSVRRRLELGPDGASLRLESTNEGTRSIVRIPEDRA